MNSHIIPPSGTVDSAFLWLEKNKAHITLHEVEYYVPSRGLIRQRLYPAYPDGMGPVYNFTTKEFELSYSKTGLHTQYNRQYTHGPPPLAMAYLDESIPYYTYPKPPDLTVISFAVRKNLFNGDSPYSYSNTSNRISLIFSENLI